MKDLKNRHFLNYLNSHSKPVTRRDFIARGLLGATSLCMLPTIGGLLARNAWSAVTDDPQDSRMPRAIVFDLVGGAGLVGNFLVGGAGGPEDLLDSYSSLGWDPRAVTLEKRFGVPMPPPEISKVLEGMLSIMSPEAQANFRFGTLLHFSIDDNGDNKHSAAAGMMQVGPKARLIETILGTYESSDSGGRTQFFQETPPYQSLYISNLNAITEYLKFTGPFANLNAEQRQKFSKSLSKLSTDQANRLLGSSPTDAGARDYLTGLIQKYSDLMTSDGLSLGLDPRADTDVQEVYGIFEGAGEARSEVIHAAMVKNTLDLNAGPSVISIGDCDYHLGELKTAQGEIPGDAKDREIGREIGRAVELAHRKKLPLFIQVLTDGGIVAPDNSREWSGDNPDRTMTVIGFYDPEGAPEYRKMQVGAFSKTGQGVDRSTVIGGNTVMAGKAVLANYMNLAGKFGQFGEIAGMSGTAAEELLIFERKAGA